MMISRTGPRRSADPAEIGGGILSQEFHAEGSMNRYPGRKHYPRRAILRWLAAAPAAAVAGSAGVAVLGQTTKEDTGFDKLDELAKPDDEEESRKAAATISDEARCLAENEDALSRSERRALMEKMKGLEEALEKLRAFDIADDVEPALIFRPLGSGGRR